MIETKWTQFHLPDGRQTTETFHVADRLAPQVEFIAEMGWELQCEILRTGEISLTVFDPKTLEDLDIELCRNGPEVPSAIDRLLARAPKRNDEMRTLIGELK